MGAMVLRNLWNILLKEQTNNTLCKKNTYKMENYFIPMMCSVYEKKATYKRIKLNLNAFFLLIRCEN